MPRLPDVPTMTPKAVLDAYGLEVRCKLLEIAAILDRHDRGKAAHGDATVTDARLERFRKSLAVLSDADATPDRAERIALIFSDKEEGGSLKEEEPESD